MTRALVVVVALFALACSESHGTGDDAGPGDDGGGTQICECCGTSVEWPASIDCAIGACDPYCLRPPPSCDCCGTTVPIDPGEDCFSGVCDPYCVVPGCELTPIALACGATPVLAGTPTTIPVLIGGDGGCYCDEIIDCRAGIDALGRVQLETSVCPGGSFCEACFPWAEGTCDLPALPPGEILVDVNGAPGFTLEVVEVDGLPEMFPACETVAERGGPCDAAWPARPVSTTRACHPEGAIAGERVAIRLVDECSGCEPRGPCHVEVVGTTIRVRSSTLGFACDIGCTDECRLREDSCWTPPLEPGTYDVQVESLDSHAEQIIVYDLGVSPPPFTEVCTAGT